MKNGSKVRTRSAAGVITEAVLLAAVLTLAGAIIIGKMMDMEIIATTAVGYGAMIVLAISAWAGAAWAVRGLGWDRILSAATGAGGYFLLLLIVNAVAFGGSYPGFWSALVITSLSAGLAVFMSGKGRGRAPRKRYKIPGV